MSRKALPVFFLSPEVMWEVVGARKSIPLKVSVTGLRQTHNGATQTPRATNGDEKRTRLDATDHANLRS